MRKATELIHAGEEVTAGRTRSLTVPIYQTSTFVFDSAAAVQDYQSQKLDGYLYSRYENPTVVSVEQRLAAVDGAEMSLLFSSGMAATAHALMTLLQQGDEVVCSAAVYGGTYHLLADLLPKFGVSTRFVTLDKLADPASIFSPATKLAWFESPISTVQKPACRMPCFSQIFSVMVSKRLSSAGSRPGTQW